MFNSVSDQCLIFGAEEGIYTLNLNELHETSMEQVGWLNCYFNVDFQIHVSFNVIIGIQQGKRTDVYLQDV